MACFTPENNAYCLPNVNAFLNTDLNVPLCPAENGMNYKFDVKDVRPQQRVFKCHSYLNGKSSLHSFTCRGCSLRCYSMNCRHQMTSLGTEFLRASFVFYTH